MWTTRIVRVEKNDDKNDDSRTMTTSKHGSVVVCYHLDEVNVLYGLRQQQGEAMGTVNRSVFGAFLGAGVSGLLHRALSDGYLLSHAVTTNGKRAICVPYIGLKASIIAERCAITSRC